MDVAQCTQAADSKNRLGFSARVSKVNSSRTIIPSVFDQCDNVAELGACEAHHLCPEGHIGQQVAALIKVKSQGDSTECYQVRSMTSTWV